MPDFSNDSSAGEAPQSNRPPAVLGTYEIRRSLGVGGMGEVLLAVDTKLGRHVALKLLPLELARHDDFVTRFYTEASAAARIDHPNVVPIHFIGRDAGWHFFVMSFVEGESLAQRLHRQGRLGIDESLSIIDDVLAGLHAAHTQGLIHRDIKPANILLDQQHGRALVADFGLVKVLGDVGGRTATGVILGTVEYMAPEQGRGRALDLRCDLYSVGVMLYRMLAGQLPFHAESPTNLIFQHVYERPPSLREINPDVPPALWAVIAKLLAKSPDLRYSDAQAVRDDLAAVRQHCALPSGADLADLEAYWKSVGVDDFQHAGSLLVTPPAFEIEVDEFSSSPSANRWWSRMYYRFRDWWQSRRPGWIAKLESTKQEIDGAVLDYQQRGQQLRSLLREADNTLTALHAQHDRRSSASANITRLIGIQFEHITSMRLKLAQVESVLQRLRSQRDLLQARWKMAQARVRLESRSTSASLTRRLLVAILCIAVTAGAIAVTTGWRNGTDDGVRTASLSGTNDEPTGIDSTYPKMLQTETVPSPSLRTPLLVADVALVHFSDDADFIQSATSGGLIEYRDSTDGHLLRTIELPTKPSARVMANFGRFFASIMPSLKTESSRTTEIRDWHTPSEVLTAVELGGHESVLAIAGDPPIAWTISSTGSDALVTKQSTPPAVHRLRGAGEAMNSHALHSSGRWIAIGSTKAITVFDLASVTDTPSLEPVAVLPITAHQLAFHPSEPWLAVVPFPGDRVVFWDVLTQKAIAELTHHGESILQMVFDPQGRRLAVASARQVRVWDLELQYLRLVIPATDSQVMAFNADGTALATADKRGELTTWSTRFPVLSSDLLRWQKSLTVQQRTQLAQHRPASDTSNDRSARSPDQRLEVMINQERRAILRDTKTQEQLLEYPAESVLSVALSPDGRILATGGYDGETRQGRIEFWDVRSGRLVGRCTEYNQQYHSLRFDSDGRSLLAGSLNEVQLWNTADYTLRRRIPHEAKHALRVNFSPDVRFLIVEDVATTHRYFYSSRTGELLWELVSSPIDWAFLPTTIIAESRDGQWKSLLTSSSVHLQP